MSKSVRVGRVGVAVSLALAALLLSVLSVATAATTGLADLVVYLSAPDHVGLDTEYVVNLKYDNLGALGTPDAQVNALLPVGTNS